MIGSPHLGLSLVVEDLSLFKEKLGGGSTRQKPALAVVNTGLITESEREGVDTVRPLTVVTSLKLKSRGIQNLSLSLYCSMEPLKFTTCIFVNAGGRHRQREAMRSEGHWYDAF